jgi:MerR family regulatory protein
LKHNRGRARPYSEPRTPQEIRDSDSGLRPSHQALLRLIDMSDPAWPSIAGVLREMTDAGVEIGEAALVIAAKVGTHRFATATVKAHPGRRPASHQATLSGTSDSIVYYIRRGDLIKIGTTADPVTRPGRLMPDKILAFEPGDADQETLRHRQFDHLRCHGEYFRSAPELSDHIRQLRHLHGKPDPSWPTTATPRRHRGKRPADSLPPLISRERLTAAEASERFGISPHAVWYWARSGLIDQAGEDDNGHRLFYAEHLLAQNARRPRRYRDAPVSDGSSP